LALLGVFRMDTTFGVLGIDTEYADCSIRPPVAKQPK
jgi:hypothetical protein